MAVKKYQDLFISMFPSGSKDGEGGDKSTKDNAPLMVPRVTPSQVSTLYASHYGTIVSATALPLNDFDRNYPGIGYSSRSIGKSTQHSAPPRKRTVHHLPVYGRYSDATMFNAAAFAPWKTPTPSELVVRVFEPTSHIISYMGTQPKTELGAQGHYVMSVPTPSNHLFMLYPTLLHVRQGPYFYPAQLVLVGRYRNAFQPDDVKDALVDVYLGCVVMERSGTYDTSALLYSANAIARNMPEPSETVDGEPISREVTQPLRSLVDMLMAKFEYGPSISESDDYGPERPQRVSSILSPYTGKGIKL